MGKNLDRAEELVAANRWDEALILFQEITASADQPADAKARAWRMISRVKREQLELDQARHALDRARALYQEAGNEEQEYLVRVEQAFDDLNNDRYIEAEHAITVIMDRAAAEGWHRTMAKSHVVRGVLYRHRNELNKAVAEYLKAIEIHTRLDEEDEVDALSMNLAKTYVRMGRFDLAKPYYERGAAYYAGQGGLNSSVIQRMGVANTAWLAKDYQLAEELYNEILEDIKDRDTGFIASVVHQGLGMLLLVRGNCKASRKHLLICLQSIEQGEHRKMRVAVLTALAIICVIEDDPQEALNYATLSRDNCVDHDDIESRLIMYYLAIVYLANDKPELASSHWDQRKAMAWTIEMELEYEWMVGMLEHILARDYAAVIQLSEQTHSLAEKWREEVQALNDGGRADAG